ncbi:hypothetical protein BD31_I1117 [Candidatus Nitrosopumilus salaria BD31]|uniref:Uncharacterized protein n=1 Tax=Candidatus Nitrosopumilus salarius BD31 TaxID=859350 RepID=I3D4M9_9ARCH|nr:hypothetical protein [Candidatus Nitrosopumilus salaria]EIJ66672.1 hypothetical protein BD31_I1117 [Candidatus Nitrosopumilus salaria BD31]
MQRSFLVFENSIKSAETLKRYKYYLVVSIMSIVAISTKSKISLKL